MELIIAILVFSVSAAVCVRMFARSYTLSLESRELSHAVAIVQSQAEIFYGNPGSVTDADIYYDKDFNVCSAESSSYEMVSSDVTDNTVSAGSTGLQRYDICVRKITGEEIYSLCVEKTAQD